MAFSTLTLITFGSCFSIAVLSTLLLYYLEAPAIVSVRLFLGALGLLLLFGITGLSVSKMPSLPLAFAVLSVVSLLSGIFYTAWGGKFFLWYHQESFASGLMTFIVWGGWAATGFTLIYGLLSPKATAFSAYLTVAVLPITVPYLFIHLYNAWLTIPTLKYRKWYYESHLSLPVLEPINIIKINIQFTKVPDESAPVFEGYWVELPRDKELGTLFHYFIYSHNNRHREHKKDPIRVESNGKKLGWLLYKRNTSDQPIYLNTDHSPVQNNIMDNETIFAQSYSN